MKRILAVATILASCLVQPSRAEDAQPIPAPPLPAAPAPGAASPQAASPSECFAIVSPVPNIPPGGFLKINKCTGDTWLLVRIGLPKAAGSELDSYTYRWLPLGQDDGKEPEFRARVTSP